MNQPTFEQIQEQLIEANPDAIFYDGLEVALIGICRRFNVTVALYDYEKCIEALMGDGGTREEVIEYLEYNTLGAWVGENTPAFFVEVDV